MDRSYSLTVWMIAFVLLILVHFLYKILRKLYMLRKIPAPESPLLVAMTGRLLYGSGANMFSAMRSYAQKFDGIYRITLLHINIVNINNAEDIEQILNSSKHLSKSRIYSYLENWLGTGLLTSTGAKWHTRRKILTPTFHFKILEEFLIRFNEETKRFVNYVKDHVEECAKDITPRVEYHALKNICETAMGLDKVDESIFIKYRKNIKEMGEVLVGRAMRPWYRIKFLYRFSSLSTKENIVVKKLHNFSNAVIRDRVNVTLDKKEKRKRLAMLDLLLKFRDDGGDIDFEGIREEVDTFMFEGHDTTSSAIKMTLLLLANHPDIQNKAAEEIDAVFGGEDRDCIPEDMNKLEYLECCIKESLRLYPSVPFISRLSSEEFTTFTGHRIPEGTILHIHIFDLHRNPTVFPDPEKFDPERFRPENSNNRFPYAYIPFSAGPRNCIGQRFAMWELKTLLCGILRHFRLEPIDTSDRDNIVFYCDLVLSTKCPIRIKFTPR